MFFSGYIECMFRESVWVFSGFGGWMVEGVRERLEIGEFKKVEGEGFLCIERGRLSYGM